MELGAGMEVGDRRALADYRTTLKDLDSELNDARNAHDEHWVEDLLEQKERVLSEISNMQGPGGKLRYANDPLRKPRDNVRKAIQRSVDNLVKANMQELATHLQPLATVQGGEIAYQPAHPITWETQPISG